MSDQDERARNREIAQNEERRKAVGAVRVSTSAIALAVIIGLIVFGIVWAWMHR
jgi:hypothetical protein